MKSETRVTEISWESEHSTLRLRRPCSGVVVLLISGSDVGEHGDGPFTELARDLSEGPIDLFIDARLTRGASIDVSSDWARWLTKHRGSLHGIDMLTGSRFIQLTATFVKNYAALGDIMRVWTDPTAFDEMLDRRMKR